jgi:hypothetical protein
VGWRRFRVGTRRGDQAKGDEAQHCGSGFNVVFHLLIWFFIRSDERCATDSGELNHPIQRSYKRTAYQGFLIHAMQNFRKPIRFIGEARTSGSAIAIDRYL